MESLGEYNGERHRGFFHGTGQFIYWDSSQFDGCWERGRKRYGSLMICKKIYEVHFKDGYPDTLINFHDPGVSPKGFDIIKFSYNVDVIEKSGGYQEIIAENPRCYVAVILDSLIQFQGKLFNGEGFNAGIRKIGQYTYIGQLKGCIAHGFGKLLHNDYEYIGEFRENKMTGIGNKYNKSGITESGEFLEGLLHGRGTIIIENEEPIFGNFLFGDIQPDPPKSALSPVAHSQVYSPVNHPAARKYNNSLKNNEYPQAGFLYKLFGDLKGKVRCEQGREGELVKGIAIMENGDVYKGTFRNGEIEGIGEYRFGNGDCFFGEFVRNCMEGFGRFESSKHGSRYRGQWKNNVPEGKGVLEAQKYYIEGIWSRGKLMSISKVLANSI